MDPRNVLLNLKRYLTDYEKNEILDYDIIYYLNVMHRKIKGIYSPDGPENYGFDNEKGEYIAVKIHEHIAYRFEVIKKLGKGAFG